MNAATPKALMPLGAVPIMIRALRPFASIPRIIEFVIVVGREWAEHARRLIADSGPFHVPMKFAIGGSHRQDSVAAGLALVSPHADFIAVHDAARPFVRSDLINAVFDSAAEVGAAILAAPALDTIKVVDASSNITSTPARDSCWLAQTPQVFRTELLRRAYDRAQREAIQANDDAALVERLGVRVRIVPGDRSNVKITTPDDLRWAEWYLKDPQRLH
jgi:2-C-methyl-D-erythritol 4-phosphate cytidylyltransferase